MGFYPTFAVVIQALLLVAVLYWCKHMASNARDHWERFRHGKDNVEKVVLAVYWLITAAVFLWAVRFIWWIVSTVVRGVVQVAG